MNSNLPPERVAPALCPQCGAAIAGRGLKCPYCGSVFRESVSDDDLQQACEALIRSCNKELASLSTGRLILAFLVFILVVPAAGHLLLRMLGVAGLAVWVLTGLLLLGGAALFGGVLEIEQKRHFRERVLPDLQRFIKKREISPEEFHAIARRTLKDDDVLFRYLSAVF